MTDVEHRAKSAEIRTIVAAVIFALIAGLALRFWAFDHTGPMRRVVTQETAFYWGDRIVHSAHPDPGSASWGSLFKCYLAFYDARAAEAAKEPHPTQDASATTQPSKQYVLDYLPLRLLMAAAWVNWLNIHYGPISHWQPEFSRSFASFSLVMEFLGAVALFALVARWLKQTGPQIRDFAPLARFSPRQKAAAAAILLWLNPASILDSQVWPHSQTWVLPFYLFATLAMLERRYFFAGVLLGLGAMFKGQILLVAPALVLWPIYDRRWLGAANVLIGMAAAIAIVTLPWLVHGSFAWARAGFAAQVEFNDVLRKDHTINLPSMLARFGRMTLHQPIINFHLAGFHLLIDLKTLLAAVYAILLAISAWGISRLARSGDRRVLAAMAAPWAVMFFFLGQMDERYLMWAASLSAASVVVGWWPLTAHVMLTFAAVTGNVEELLYDKPAVHPTLLHLVRIASPLTLATTAVGVAILWLVSIRRPERISAVPAPTETPQPVIQIQ